MKLLSKPLKYLKNAVKSTKTNIFLFLSNRWKDLTDNNEKIIKESPKQMDEKPEPIKEDNSLELLKKELEELRKFKEDTEKFEKRKPLYDELKLTDTEKKYINMLLDGIEGDDDKIKLETLKKELPSLFNKENEKNFDVDLKKLSDEEKKQAKGFDPKEIEKLGLGE